MGFAYHGSAVAFGARIDKPSPDIIPSQASAVLMPTGGEATAVVRNFDYKGIISFDEAKSYVTGSFEAGVNGEPGAYNTLATTAIRNLNIANMLHIEYLVGRVSSKHVVNEKGMAAEEGDITFDGSILDGVKLAGLKGDVDLDTKLFADYPTFDSFTGKFPDDDRYKAKSELFWSDPVSAIASIREGGGDPTTGRRRPSSNPGSGEEERKPCVPQVFPGTVNCSLFTSLSHKIEPKDPRSTTQNIYRDGYGIVIREFGTVYLAEILMKRGQRRLSMVRVELGCPLCGSGGGGVIEGNGSPTMPP
ncbi:MAG: hypothetical protein JWO56_2066 [Acidobacteria bacterium]|nr:hypothetical protein [Acidobacteriota bacterium]